MIEGKRVDFLSEPRVCKRVQCEQTDFFICSPRKPYNCVTASSQNMYRCRSRCECHAYWHLSIYMCSVCSIEVYTYSMRYLKCSAHVKLMSVPAEGMHACTCNEKVHAIHPTYMYVCECILVAVPHLNQLCAFSCHDYFT